MKNINRWLLITSLIVFSFGNVETMSPLCLTSQKSSFDMKKNIVPMETYKTIS